MRYQVGNTWYDTVTTPDDLLSAYCKPFYGVKLVGAQIEITRGRSLFVRFDFENELSAGVWCALWSQQTGKEVQHEA